MGEYAVDGAAPAQAHAQYNANGQPNKVGQLTAVRQQDTSLASYTYSHRGERIGKTVQGHTAQYLYNDAGQTAKRYQIRSFLRKIHRTMAI